MAVFRVEKTRNYTVMSNHHLRDKSLSLKAKGLLSLMLSLPEDWDYTTRGLAYICKDGVDSICATVRELEGAGYIVRERERHADGTLGGIEYTILEQPRGMDEPKRENPVQVQISCIERYGLFDFIRRKVYNIYSKKLRQGQSPAALSNSPVLSAGLLFDISR